ncbi:Putative N-acetylmannosaminyltransferase [Pirellula sp. SH-Sr6A]|nr:Putative N-acetylmannosaminyltransferase [Pirellula sp. SH-Sr6A]
MLPSDLSTQTLAPSPDVHLAWPRRFPVLNIHVSATTYAELTEVILQAALNRQSAIVSCHSVHAVVTASVSRDLCQKVNSFDAVTPDGQPVRWSLRWLHGIRLQDRVYGPELTLRVCEEAARKKVGIYLYGGTFEVLEKLTHKLQTRYPGLVVHGEAPPFRALTEQEDRAVVERIEKSGAGIVFIGLGCPKQDEFAFAHRSSIHAVQICVGAAFDFHAGVKKMAPPWMQRNGLEWLFRLCQEPRRLWWRYLSANTSFLYLLLGQFLRGKKSPN